MSNNSFDSSAFLSKKVEGAYTEIVPIQAPKGGEANLHVILKPDFSIKLVRDDFPPEEDITQDMIWNRARNLALVAREMSLPEYFPVIKYLGSFGTVLFGPRIFSNDFIADEETEAVLYSILINLMMFDTPEISGVERVTYFNRQMFEVIRYLTGNFQSSAGSE